VAAAGATATVVATPAKEVPTFPAREVIPKAIAESSILTLLIGLSWMRLEGVARRGVDCYPASPSLGHARGP
jgi:hypothetical protein